MYCMVAICVVSVYIIYIFFFFQAEDGIRDGLASLPAQLTKSPFCLKSGPKSSKIPDKSHSGICARSAFDGFPQRFSLRDGGHRHHGYAAVVYTSFPTTLRASSFAGR